jgi:putative PIN family toxin of toxin-antitoxin system
MRIVIDTNVFVSGVFWGGPPAQVLQAWRDERLEIVLSPAILDEYRRVGREIARRFPLIDLDPIIDALALGAHIVPDCDLPRPVCSDPDDDMFIAAAVAGRATFLISGDRGLLRVGDYGGVRILAPATFVRLHLKGL